MTKRAYERPSLDRIGSFEKLTRGGSQSGVLDKQFPPGTPSSVGVFS